MPNQTTHGHPRNGFWKNFGQELHTHHVSRQRWHPMYSMHIGNGIMVLVGLLHSIIGISAIVHFGNGGLPNREEFYLYWWSTTSLVHVLFFLKLKKKMFLSLPEVDLDLLFIYYSVSNLKKYFSLRIWCGGIGFVIIVFIVP